MTIKEIHDTINFWSRKSGNLGMIPHEDIDRALNFYQYEVFDSIKPKYGANQQLHDLLRPFKKTMNLTNGNTTGGAITFPNDYYHLLAISRQYMDDITRYSSVDILGDDEIDNRLDSDLKAPSEAYPVGVYTATGVQLYPSVATAGTFRYLKKPATCVFAYTLSGRTVTYNSGSSVQLEWNEEGQKLIIYKTLLAMGVNLQDPSLIQVSQTKEGLDG